MATYRLPGAGCASTLLTRGEYVRIRSTATSCRRGSKACLHLYLLFLRFDLFCNSLGWHGLILGLGSSEGGFYETWGWANYTEGYLHS